MCPNYSVSRSSHDLPSFRLVDVPGLGYAETEENVQVRYEVRYIVPYCNVDHFVIDEFVLCVGAIICLRNSVHMIRFLIFEYALATHIHCILRIRGALCWNDM